MFTAIHVLFYYLKRIISSSFTYFVVAIILLVFLAKDFRQSHAEDSSGDTVQDSIARYALSLKGINYRAGGTNTSGFDCSGFTFFVFKKFGYQLPRASSAQFEAGAPVDKERARDADLIFFKGTNLNRDRIGHVGIIIQADSCKQLRFIHASNSGVRIDSLNSDYYHKRFLGIKRIFNFN